MRGRIDGDSRLVVQGIGALLQRGRALARSPAALPIAFVAGIVAERLEVPGIKRVYRLLADQFKVIKVASGLLGLPLR